MCAQAVAEAISQIAKESMAALSVGGGAAGAGPDAPAAGPRGLRTSASDGGCPVRLLPERSVSPGSAYFGWSQMTWQKVAGGRLLVHAVALMS